MCPLLTVVCKEVKWWASLLLSSPHSQSSVYDPLGLGRGWRKEVNGVGKSSLMDLRGPAEHTDSAVTGVGPGVGSWSRERLTLAGEAQGCKNGDVETSTWREKQGVTGRGPTMSPVHWRAEVWTPASRRAHGDAVEAE